VRKSRDPLGKRARLFAQSACTRHRRSWSLSRNKFIMRSASSIKMRRGGPQLNVANLPELLHEKILSTRTSGHCVTAVTSRGRGRKVRCVLGQRWAVRVYLCPRLPKKAISNEIRHPYIVEVAIVGDELNVQLSRRIMQFHQSQRIQPRYGRTITTNKVNSIVGAFPISESQHVIRLCWFPN
jgi:hypothetical protein